MGAHLHNPIPDLETRNGTFYLRKRVPTRYQTVETRREINQSLKTKDAREALTRSAVLWQTLVEDWDLRLSMKRSGNSLSTFEKSMKLLDSWGMPFRPQSTLIEGPIQTLLDRIEKITTVGVTSPAVPAILGTLDLPEVLISEMPAQMLERHASRNASKTANQMREWRNKYRNAAKLFITVVGDKPVHEITEEDAMAFTSHWRERVVARDITALHAIKRLRFLRQMIDEYFEIAQVPPSRRMNPMKDMKISRDLSSEDPDRRKAALPAPWVRKLVTENLLAGMNPEAGAIAVIAAECGTRQSEVYNLPAADIFLDADIPHFTVRPSETDGQKRQIKNRASIRPVPLLGAALEAMCQFPEGFPSYFGKGKYSGTVNKYLRENGLFPSSPNDTDVTYTIGGTRHSYEDRMIAARMSNEERAYMMGHSIKAIRGRPVYGSDPDLRLRSLYQELVAHQTSTWSPRPPAEIWNEVDIVNESMGFRIR